MTIVSIKAGATEDVRRIALSDGSCFSFNISYLPPIIDENRYSPGIEGLAITQAEEEAFRFASACLRAEKAALQLITRAEQTVFGLSRKLEKRGHDTACARAVITRLCETGLLDDHRYARLWLESRLSCLQGKAQQTASPRRLLAALRARVERHAAETALKEALDDETEQQLLEGFMQKQSRTKSLDRSALRYQLKGEGFSSFAIQRYFDNS
ncbi:MAG: RecX family transcriptional regulator [Treponema sp.]|nr:RecX family transcriptional regulator [Treponema sp.]